jgi:hypothetical protein
MSDFTLVSFWLRADDCCVPRGDRGLTANVADAGQGPSTHEENAMNTIAFDRLTRTAAAGVTPRRSLLTLGAAGVAAALAAPYTVDAKKKKGKKKKQQQSPVPALVPAPAPAPAPVPVPAPDRCAPQVAECTTTVANSICPDPSLPRCQRAAACCSHLGTCEFNQFFACLALVG